MWCWIRDQRWVTFDYTPRGTAESVRIFLGEDLHRTVQCDGTPRLSFPERAGGQAARLLGARAPPLRRGDAPLALPGLKLTRTLLAVERLSAIHPESAEQRKARRLEQSRPVPRCHPRLGRRAAGPSEDSSQPSVGTPQCCPCGAAHRRGSLGARSSGARRSRARSGAARGGP